MIRVLVLVVMVAVAVEGMSSGAPAGACSDMKPGHGFDFKQNVDYGMKVSNNADGTVTVALGTITGVKFKGFLVKAVNQQGQTIGKFTTAPNTVDCDGLAQSAATHADSSERSGVTLIWEGPANPKFLATIAKSYSDYYQL